MAKLNQLVAVEKGVKKDKDEIWTAAYQLFDQPARFQGSARSYAPLQDDGVQLPEEQQLVQVTIPDLVETVQTAITRLFDVVSTKDAGNTEARADIKIQPDGETLASSVPVTTLLWLEKQLADLHTFGSKMPILDPSKNWAFDEQNGFYAADPVETVKSNKVMQNHVKYEATPEHPAQVEVFTTDEPVGRWTTKHFSGAVPKAVRDAVVERIGLVQEAVKFAREEANGITVTDVNIGESILNYVFEPVANIG